MINFKMTPERIRFARQVASTYRYRENVTSNHMQEFSLNVYCFCLLSIKYAHEKKTVFVSRAIKINRCRIAIHILKILSGSLSNVHVN